MKIIHKDKDKSHLDTVGKILKHYREKANYSIDEIACFFDGNIVKIEAWESDVEEPSITDCLILSKLYSVPLEDMFHSINVLSKVAADKVDAFESSINMNRLASRWYE